MLSIAAVVVWLSAAIQAISVIGKPFPGFLFEPNLDVATMSYPDWNGHKAGLVPYDRLVGANGALLREPGDLDALVSSVPVGTSIEYRLWRKGTYHTVVVATQMFEVADFFKTAFFWLLGAGGYLATGILVFALRPGIPAARSHLLLTLGAGTMQALLVFLYLTHWCPMPLLWEFFFFPAGLLHLAMTFPVMLPSLRSRPVLAVVPYLPAILVPLVMLAGWKPVGHAVSPAIVDSYFAFQSAWAAAMLVGILALLANLVFAFLKAPSPRERNQAQVVMLGAVATFGIVLSAFLVPVLSGTTSDMTWGQVAAEYAGMILFPLSVAYAIVRHQLFDIRLVIRRATLYLVLAIGLAGIYIAVAGGAERLLAAVSPEGASPSLAGFLSAIAVAAAFRPMHDHLRRALDRRFLGPKADALRLLADFGHRLQLDEPAAASDLVDLANQAFRPSWAFCRVAGETLAISGILPPNVGPACEPGADLALRVGVQPLDALVSVPAEERGLSIVVGIGRPSERQSALFLGPKANGMPYDADEQAVLRVVAGQAAIALEHARVVREHSDLKVREAVSAGLAAEREQLLKQVIHDVRSDLFSIQIAADLVRDEPSDAAPVEAIDRSLGRIAGLLAEKALWLANGRPAGRCLLAEALDQAIEAVEPQLATRGQRLEVVRPDGDPILGLTAVEFQQVIVNLLDNASKYSPAGSAIRVVAAIEADDLVLQVIDEGPGIPEAVAPDLCSGKRGNPEVPGSGLGLQNVRAILEKARGTLTWRNGDRGAVFEVRVPVAEGGGRASSPTG